MWNLYFEVENAIFQALAHPMRRAILEIISSNPKISYTELITELQLSTGKLNYHLERLEGLIEKNAERHYVLTPLGKKALDQMNYLKEETSAEVCEGCGESSEDKSSASRALFPYRWNGVFCHCCFCMELPCVGCVAGGSTNYCLHFVANTDCFGHWFGLFACLRIAQVT
jgi:predicted transcriptional regulator